MAVLGAVLVRKLIILLSLTGTLVLAGCQSEENTDGKLMKPADIAKANKSAGEGEAKGPGVPSDKGPGGPAGGQPGR